MKNLFGKFIFLVIISFAFVFSAPAWDDTGHKLTTYIAWEQMSPTAREKAIKILLAAPEDSDLSVFYLQDSRSAAAKQRELFMIASTWADIVRDKNFKNRFAMYHKGDWHYADTFWSNANGKVEVLKDFAEPKGKAVEQLFAFDKSLRDAAVSDADKAIALAWVLHLGGDIHQPLHTSARVTQYDPKGDQGGNLFSLSPKGATGNDRVSLHWYWDSIVGRNIARVNDACDSDYLPAIAKQITDKYPLSKMQNRMKLGKFDEWQQEGFQISSTKLYPASLKFGEMPSDDYKKMAFNISEEQLALAGYRMGAMLNQIFDNKEITREEYDRDKIKYEQDLGGGKIGKSADDSWLWFKSRAALATANDLRDSFINLSVEDSIVTLNGTVSNDVQKTKATAIVKGIDGVKEVRNFLKISSK